MEIKGPTGPVIPPIDSGPIRAPSPGQAAVATTTSAAKPNTLQLSPSLFQIGQLLEVIVAKVESQVLTLMLQNPILDEHGQRINLQLKAAATFEIQPGQQLTVQVKNIENGVPQLQVLATQAQELDLPTLLQGAQQQQQPLPPLYANLAQLQQLQSRQQLDTLPAPVRQRIETLWRSLPDSSQIQKPAGLKQAMQYSGPFLESALLQLAQGQGQSYPALDVKTGLLRLANAIRTQLESNLSRLSNQPQTEQTAKSSTQDNDSDTQAIEPRTINHSADPKNSAGATPEKTTNTAQTQSKPFELQLPQAQSRVSAQINNLTTEHLLEQLLQQTEGGLARIVTQQLHAASHDPQRPMWLLELPVRHEQGVDVFDLRIHRDPEEKPPAQQVQHTWTVMLAFDLPNLGPVRAQVSLLHNQISSFWWADQSSTVELFHQHLQQLHHRMTAAGLKVNKLHCQLGIPDTAQPRRTLPISNVTLDEKI